MAKYTPDTYFLNPAHEDIARSRYYLKDDTGLPIEKNIFEVFTRVNNYIYKDDLDHKDAAQLFCEEKKIMYAGRPLAQAGTGISNMYNCFVLDIDDSRESISEAQRVHFHVQAHGGGTGFNFSKLRPSGSWCKGAQARSSGPEGFITALGYLSSNISQGGNRSGANLGLLEDWHPGLLKFITKKSRSNWENIRKFAVVTDENRFKQWQTLNDYAWQTFNVSVALSDDFMRQVKRKAKKPWVLQWKGTDWHLWDYEILMEDNLPNGEKITTTLVITVCAPNKEIAMHEALNEVPFRNSARLKLVQGPYDLSAYEWFRKICTNAWEDGCPGVVFMDTIRKYHNGEYFNPVLSTNPCYTGDQYLLTSKGYRTFGELYQTQERVELVQDARVEYFGPRSDANNPTYWQIDEMQPGYVTNSAGPVFLTQRGADVVKITTKDGLVVRCTPDHHLAVLGRGMVEAQALCPGDKLLVADTPIIEKVDKSSADYSIGLLYGMFLGDGHVNNSGTSDKVIIGLWGEDIEQEIAIEKAIQNLYEGPYSHLQIGRNGRCLRPYHRTYISDRKELRIVSTYLKKVFEEVGIFDGVDKYKFSAGTLDAGDFFAGVFSGLLFTDGTIGYNEKNKNLSVRIGSSWPELLTQLQRQALLYGAPSRIYRRREAGFRPMPDGCGGTRQYQVKAFYELIFSGLARDRLMEVVTLFGAKSEKYQSYRSTMSQTYRTFWSKVESVVPDGKEDVYCLTENDRRTVVVNGITGRRCGEQPLPAWAVCCLSSIVLPEFVTSDGDLDWEGLGDAVAALVRSLNWITLHNRTGVEQIDNNAKQERRIGLGTIGMHEMLIRMSLLSDREYIYSQDSGRAMAKKVLKFIKHAAYEASIDLAQEIGPFPAFKYGEFIKSKFMRQLLKERPDLKEKLREHGIANVTVLSQAPTGTSGTITGYSSGCEPYYAMAYLRNTRSSAGTIMDGCPSFHLWLKEKGIDYAEYGYNLKELRKSKRVPKCFEEAQDISWRDHLAMQAVFAEQVDSSVSKTINLPNSATVEDIMAAYIEAYKLGIKSTAVYRDGSKTQILESLKKSMKTNEARPQTIITLPAPKRPDDLDCDIHTVSIKGDRWKVLVGILYNRPYEVFCFPEEHIEISPSRHKGTLRKNGHGRYNLLIGSGEDVWVIKNIAQLLLTDEHRMITRLLSASLRHGAPLNALVSQLSKCDGDVTTFSKAILRVLKKYITEEEYLEVSRCKACGSKNLGMEQGCLLCRDCGRSACD